MHFVDLPPSSEDRIYDAVYDRRSEPEGHYEYRSDEQAVEERVQDGSSNQSGDRQPNDKYRYYPTHKMTSLHHCDKLSQWL